MCCTSPGNQSHHLVPQVPPHSPDSSPSTACHPPGCEQTFSGTIRTSAGRERNTNFCIKRYIFSGKGTHQPCMRTHLCPLRNKAPWLPLPPTVGPLVGPEHAQDLRRQHCPKPREKGCCLPQVLPATAGTCFSLSTSRRLNLLPKQIHMGFPPTLIPVLVILKATARPHLPTRIQSYAQLCSA